MVKKYLVIRIDMKRRKIERKKKKDDKQKRNPLA
jgi:hypothetical protein